ncbi:HNH endonuclease [Pseudoalteromonas sp. P1-9]|uniref:HNH endonuclease n=1 Tax=Pseudoalteromonas sp. P1-9 TaxID=1710354 RepID=UPI00137918C5|nr:HNH endonuclease [Pseudoalteromonas sp. P1-9]
MNFKQWIVSETKAKESSATKYNGAISGRLSRMAIANNLTNVNLLEVQNPNSVALKLKSLDEFIELNSTGNSMYSRALDLFIEYCSFQDLNLERDLDEILADKTTSVTEKSSLIKARIGQGSFRKSLIDMWQGCAVTSSIEEQLLVASHIKPWKDSNSQERLDKFNGLLLVATIDRAFDSGLISFSDSGNILISSKFKEPSKAGIEPTMNISLFNENLPYLKYHRNYVYKGT